MLVSGIAQSGQNLALSRLAMSTHALLNLLNELRKIDKMRVVNLYCDMSLSKGHLGSRGGGGGEASEIKLKDTSFIFPMTNATISGVFRTHAQKEYGKVWEMKSTPIFNVLALLLF